MNYIGHVSGVLLHKQKDTGWAPAAVINKTAPSLSPVLINSARDAFLCVYLKSEKRARRQKVPPTTEITGLSHEQDQAEEDCLTATLAQGCRDIAFDIVTTLLADRPSNCDSTTGRDRRLSVLQRVRTG